MNLLTRFWGVKDQDEPGLATCISYPKSGRTWLRVMLDEAGLPLRYKHGGSAFHQKRFRNPGDFLRQGKVLFLARDPIDTAVSGYFHVTKREAWRDLFRGSVSDFVLGPLGVQRTAAFNRMWTEAVAGHPNALMTTYEALHEDAGREIRRIAAWLELRLGEEDVNRAVASGRFDTMQAREKSDDFDRAYYDKLRPVDVRDQESFKVRKGRVGGASEYLEGDDLAQCRAILARVATER